MRHDGPFRAARSLVGKARVVFPGGVDEVPPGVCRVARHRNWNGIDHLPQLATRLGKLSLSLAQRLLGLLGFIDVRQENVPAHDAPGVIADSAAAGFKPPIFAVEPAQTLFEVVGNLGGYRSPKIFKHMGKVFRMNHIGRYPVLLLFHRSAKILDALAIDGFDFTVRGHDRDETGYPVKC